MKRITGKSATVSRKAPMTMPKETQRLPQSKAQAAFKPSKGSKSTASGSGY